MDARSFRRRPRNARPAPAGGVTAAQVIDSLTITNVSPGANSLTVQYTVVGVPGMSVDVQVSVVNGVTHQQRRQHLLDGVGEAHGTIAFEFDLPPGGSRDVTIIAHTLSPEVVEDSANATIFGPQSPGGGPSLDASISDIALGELAATITTRLTGEGVQQAEVFVTLVSGQKQKTAQRTVEMPDAPTTTEQFDFTFGEPEGGIEQWVVTVEAIATVTDDGSAPSSIDTRTITLGGAGPPDPDPSPGEGIPPHLLVALVALGAVTVATVR